MRALSMPAQHAADAAAVQKHLLGRSACMLGSAGLCWLSSRFVTRYVTQTSHMPVITMILVAVCGNAWQVAGQPQALPGAAGWPEAAMPGATGCLQLMQAVTSWFTFASAACSTALAV